MMSWIHHDLSTFNDRRNSRSSNTTWIRMERWTSRSVPQCRCDWLLRGHFFVYSYIHGISFKYRLSPHHFWTWVWEVISGEFLGLICLVHECLTMIESRMWSIHVHPGFVCFQGSSRTQTSATRPAFPSTTTLLFPKVLHQNWNHF